MSTRWCHGRGQSHVTDNVHLPALQQAGAQEPPSILGSSVNELADIYGDNRLGRCRVLNAMAMGCMIAIPTGTS